MDRTAVAAAAVAAILDATREAAAGQRIVSSSTSTSRRSCEALAANEHLLVLADESDSFSKMDSSDGSDTSKSSGGGVLQDSDDSDDETLIVSLHDDDSEPCILESGSGLCFHSDGTFRGIYINHVLHEENSMETNFVFCTMLTRLLTVPASMGRPTSRHKLGRICALSKVLLSRLDNSTEDRNEKEENKLFARYTSQLHAQTALYCLFDTSKVLFCEAFKKNTSFESADRMLDSLGKKQKDCLRDVFRVASTITDMLPLILGRESISLFLKTSIDLLVFFKNCRFVDQGCYFSALCFEFIQANLEFCQAVDQKACLRIGRFVLFFLNLRTKAQKEKNSDIDRGTIGYELGKRVLVQTGSFLNKKLLDGSILYHVLYLADMNVLANLCFHCDLFEEAAALYQECIEIGNRLLATETFSTQELMDAMEKKKSHIYLVYMRLKAAECYEAGRQMFEENGQYEKAEIWNLLALTEKIGILELDKTDKTDCSLSSKITKEEQQVLERWLTAI